MAEKMKKLLKSIGAFFPRVGRLISHFFVGIFCFVLGLFKKRSSSLRYERSSARRSADILKSGSGSGKGTAPKRIGAFFAALMAKLSAMSKKTLIYASLTAVFVMGIVISLAIILPSIANASSGPKVSSEGVLSAAAVESGHATYMTSAEPGMQNSTVLEMHEILMELGYMGADEPTDIYNEQTEEAIRLFQRKHGLEITGIADEETFHLLFSDDAESYTVSEGDEGNDVYDMQERLVELDYLTSATGYFDTSTAEAVKLFQTRNHLSSDGKIGEMTRAALYSEDAHAYALAYGEESEEVRELQKRLKELGYLTTEPDGKYGGDTVAAVKRFQLRNGLISDGYLGATTKSTLLSDAAEVNQISIGDQGEDVTRIQKRLAALNYMSGASGYFGESTATALKSFQKRNGLTADGKYGVATATKLFSSSAKKAAVPTRPPGGSTGGSTGGNTGGGTGTTPDISGANITSLISAARSRLGCRYILGAKGPNSFDCSGLVYWCLKQIGLNQGYMTSIGWRTTTRYQRISSMNSIQAGDILVFKMSASQGHVGIATSSSTMVDASTSKGMVVERTFFTSYWNKYFYCAYRIF